jgi:hypothetical protein
MRFLKISGPGVVHDEAFCPNCHVLLDAQEGYQVCHLCHNRLQNRYVRQSACVSGKVSAPQHRGLADGPTGVGPRLARRGGFREPWQGLVRGGAPGLSPWGLLRHTSGLESLLSGMPSKNTWSMFTRSAHIRAKAM